MRTASVAVGALLLLGCGGLDGQAPAEAYLDWKDRLVIKTGLPLFGLTPPCTRVVGSGEDQAFEQIPTDECVKMTAPRRWKGLLRSEFELSRFCRAPARACSPTGGADQTWLSFAGPGAAVLPGRTEGLFEIEFIGRRTIYAGRYGHMGLSRHEMIVDRLISARRVEEK